MREIEYILMTNQINVRAIESILRDCLGGHGYGITKREIRFLSRVLYNIRTRLYHLIEIDRDD